MNNIDNDKLNKEIEYVMQQYKNLLYEHSLKGFLYEAKNANDVHRLSAEWKIEWDRLLNEREEKIQAIKNQY